MDEQELESRLQALEKDSHPKMVTVPYSRFESVRQSVVEMRIRLERLERICGQSE